ncbi:MAG: hypothetical protein KDK91_02480 [Gammaproteobacteria bacterium]|nr:hypothetical protein [Gammaproteobacteria bacterium]
MSQAHPPVSTGLDPFDQSHRKMAGSLPLFDPLAGTVVAEPPCQDEGCWAGGPSALFDDRDSTFYLSYRIRTQLRDHGRAGRGGETVVATSPDGVRFEKVWSASKDAFEALSIEKSCLAVTSDGRFRLYVSYSSRHDYRWHIDMLEAGHPRDFDPARRITVLSPDATGTEGVKDPVIYQVGGLWHMYVNAAPKPPGADFAKFDRMHREGNAFVSGEIASTTALATSVDGLRWTWHGDVIVPGESWDRYMTRISALVYTPPVFTAIYDGRPNSGANYTDSPSLAISTDLRNFHKVDWGHGRIRSPHGRGTLRYVECLRVGSTLHYYYEMARTDFAHELRTVQVRLAE